MLDYRSSYRDWAIYRLHSSKKWLQSYLFRTECDDCKDTVNQLVENGLEVAETPIDLSDLSTLKAQTEEALSIWGTVHVLSLIHI